MTDKIYESAADTAKKIRKALKDAFPGVTFGVRSKTYSMGSSVHVSWIDGPQQQAVDSILSQFQSTTFNGMDDSTSYHGYLYEGQRYSGAKSVRGQRERSPELKARLLEAMPGLTDHDLDFYRRANELEKEWTVQPVVDMALRLHAEAFQTLAQSQTWDDDVIRQRLSILFDQLLADAFQGQSPSLSPFKHTFFSKIYDHLWQLFEASQTPTQPDHFEFIPLKPRGTDKLAYAIITRAPHGDLVGELQLDANDVWGYVDDAQTFYALDSTTDPDARQAAIKDHLFPLWQQLESELTPAPIVDTLQPAPSPDSPAHCETCGHLAQTGAPFCSWECMPDMLDPEPEAPVNSFDVDTDPYADLVINADDDPYSTLPAPALPSLAAGLVESLLQVELNGYVRRSFQGRLTA